MKLNIFTLIFSLVLIASLQACYYDNEEYLYQYVNAESNCDTTAVSFSADVFPILEAQCVNCHSGAAPSGNISLDSHENIQIHVDNSRLWGAISHQSGFSAMPKGGNQLPACQLAQIRAWINQGSSNN